jgi:hypothetical protein
VFLLEVQKLKFKNNESKQSEAAARTRGRETGTEDLKIHAACCGFGE